MLARGELEEILPIAKMPKGVVFNALELSKRSEDYAINSVRHETYYFCTRTSFCGGWGKGKFSSLAIRPLSFWCYTPFWSL
jgi:hypothetical protein